MRMKAAVYTRVQIIARIRMIEAAGPTNIRVTERSTARAANAGKGTAKLARTRIMRITMRRVMVNSRYNVALDKVYTEAK